MPVDNETRDDSGRMTAPKSRPVAGILVMFAAGRPAASAFEIGPDGLVFGRGSPAGVLDEDERISRRHVRIAVSETARGNAWTVEDLESRNGTYVDGRRLANQLSFERGVLVRLGRSLIWTVDDVRPYLGHSMTPTPQATGELILGGTLRRAFGEIALASRSSDTLLVMGESGAGKELAARAFHDARHPARGKDAPFVAVNCAAIPEGLAERLLFGTRKGAFSGATADADGYVQEADGGTLFLDEVAELDPLVQAKLLRVLETREVLPLGASKPRSVQIAICAASHRRLRDEVAAGRFREDLYYRIGRPEVVVPPLRERLDEIPWFVASLLANVDPRLTATVDFIEACALRRWPGNVRELKREVVRAAHRALEEGVITVDSDHLLEEAGAAVGVVPAARREGITRFTDEEVRRALAANAGNVRATARALDVHRNQLRRWLEKNGPASAPSAPEGSTLPPDEDE
jgi:transcriptional regulator of acetoin/glycerol metabolism